MFAVSLDNLLFFLLIAAVMVATGSFVIQKIIEIEI